MWLLYNVKTIYYFLLTILLTLSHYVIAMGVFLFKMKHIIVIFLFLFFSRPFFPVGERKKGLIIISYRRWYFEIHLFEAQT